MDTAKSLGLLCCAMVDNLFGGGRHVYIDDQTCELGVFHLFLGDCLFHVDIRAPPIDGVHIDTTSHQWKTLWQGLGDPCREGEILTMATMEGLAQTYWRFEKGMETSYSFFIILVTS